MRNSLGPVGIEATGTAETGTKGTTEIGTKGTVETGAMGVAGAVAEAYQRLLRPLAPQKSLQKQGNRHTNKGRLQKNGRCKYIRVKKKMTKKGKNKLRKNKNKNKTKKGKEKGTYP